MRERNVFERKCITCAYCIHPDTNPTCAFKTPIVQVDLSGSCDEWAIDQSYHGMGYDNEYDAV